MTTAERVPFDRDAEQSVLGALVDAPDRASAVLEVLEPGDFHEPRHRVIFETALNLLNKGPLDATILKDELDRNGLLGEVGGAAYLSELLEAYGTASNIGAYADIVLERSLRRRAISRLGDLRRAAGNGTNLEELATLAASLSSELSDRVPTKSGADIFRLAPVDLASLLEGEPEPVAFVHEPEIPAGRRVWAFGAAESGKSIWAAWVASKVTREGRHVLYVSEENPLDEEVRRLRRLKPNPEYLRFVAGSGLDLALPEHVQATIEAAQGCELAIFDTLSACWTGDENDNAAIAALDRDALMPLVQATGASVLMLDHTGHPQAFVKRGGVNAGRGASAKGQKADVVLNFAAKATQSEFMLSVGKARGLLKPPGRVLRAMDTDDGGLDIVEVGASEDLNVAEVAEEMVQAITAAGHLTTNALREAVRTGSADQTTAMRLLELEEPARVSAHHEVLETAKGRQRCKVWRLPDGQETLGE